MIDSGEQWDDGNLFNYDGCSSKWTLEPGFIWTGGSSTTPDVCIENQFMPKASMTVMMSNNLYIEFNDTLYMQNIEQSDLMVRIFGSEQNYEFSWIAQFIDQSSVSVIMSIQSNIVGQGDESVVLDFLNPDKFVSIYSKRGVNPQELSGYLNTYKSAQTSSTSIGQTTMIVFLCSVVIGLISSFGGNSMEMIWNLTNTLQIIFFLSYTYVNFPDNLSTFFTYLQYTNAANPFLSEITYLILPPDNFKRGSVSTSNLYFR